MQHGYRTLMTRGMKGCYVYFTDGPLERHFRGSPRPLKHFLEAARKDPQSRRLSAGSLGLTARCRSNRGRELLEGKRLDQRPRRTESGGVLVRHISHRKDHVQPRKARSSMTGEYRAGHIG